jgi:TonB dependent receptor/Carboxypeptidase regulatory-like domain/TonB-dependent Receptor Plug Domain
MRLHRLLGLMAAGAASVVLATPALAQTTGGLSGQIIDANTQKPVADAVVIAQSPSLQGEQTAVTDATGSFEITLLPSGVYSLTVQREGYNAFSQQGLTIRVDRTIKVKLQLVPDTVQATGIEIVAQRPVIAVTSAAQGGTISKEQMNLIPYGRNARNFEAVATSIPGVKGDQYGFSVGGSGSPESNYVIDGVNVTDPAFGTQGSTLIQDFIQEVDIKTGGYQAEYGRSTGGIINVVTKSGGNDFHGSVFANYSPFEASRNSVGVQAIAEKDSQRYNLDFGGELGGPIIKDKLWFFAGFAPQFISINRDRIIQALTDDGTGNAVKVNGSPVLHQIGLNHYTNTFTTYQFTTKLTYLLNENHTLALAVFGNPGKSTGAQGGTANALLGNEGSFLYDTVSGSEDVSLRYQGKLLNRTMLVEASVGFHHQIGAGPNRQNAGGLAGNINNVGVGNFSAADMRDMPGISWRQTHNLLDPAFADGTQPASQTAANLGACAVQPDNFNPCPVFRYRTGGVGFEANSTLNRIGGVLKLSNFVELLGHHQFKYGIDVARDIYDQSKYYSGGAYFYALSDPGSVTPTRFFQFRGYGHASATNPATPAIDNSTPGVLRFQDSTENTSTKNTSIAFFAQDTWSILDKLVLDVGVRGEKQLLYADSKSVVPDTAGNIISGPSISLTNWMPRVGLIYDFTGRGLSKVYASYGRFYEYVPLDLADRAVSAEQQVGVSTNIQACANPHDPRTCAIVPGGGSGGTTGRTYAFTGTAAGTAVDPNLQGQYIDEYQGGVQYQLYRDITVGIDYQRKQLGRVIEDMSVDDGNTYFLSNPGEPGKFGYQAVTGNGVVVQEPKPVRIYDGVTFSVRKDFSENYLVTASYTYSYFRGNYPGLFKPDTGQLDPNITSEYDLVSLLPNRNGPLPGNTPNSFKVDAAYVYELDSRTTLQFGGNVRADQGGPINYLGAHPVYGAGEAYILPRASAGNLPWTYSINLRAQAAYKLSSDYNLGVSVDVFNVTNQQAVQSVDENYTLDSVKPIVNGTVADLAYLKNTSGAPVTVNPTFNTPTAYQLPLSLRVGAKLSF